MMVSVTVTAPAFSLRASSTITFTDQFTLTVTPAQAPSNVAMAYGYTHLPVTVDITLPPDDDKDGIHMTGGDQPGDVVVYMIDVTNSGEYTDTYSVSLHDHSWVVSSSHTTVGPLAPQATETVMISVTVGAEETVSDTVRVRFTSSLDTNLFNEVVLQTWVITDYPVYLPVMMRQE